MELKEILRKAKQKYKIGDKIKTPQGIFTIRKDIKWCKLKSVIRADDFVILYDLKQDKWTEKI